MELTEKKIAELKAKHGEIYAIETEDKTALFRKPNRKDISFAQASAAGDQYKMNEVLFANCWIEGDEEIKTELEYFLACLGEFTKIIEIKSAELKKL